MRRRQTEVRLGGMALAIQADVSSAGRIMIVRLTLGVAQRHNRQGFRAAAMQVVRGAIILS